MNCFRRQLFDIERALGLLDNDIIFPWMGILLVSPFGNLN